MKPWTVVFLCVLALGCVENRRTWFIRQNQAWSGDPPDCLVPDDPNALFRTVGQLDLVLRDNFVLTPLIENQLMSRKDYTHLRDEPNGIQVEGAEIRIWCDEVNDAPNFGPFFSPASSYLDPESTGPSAFIAIHAGIVEALAPPNFACCPGGAACDEQLVMLGVRMQGITNGGIETETPEFYYPVFVCSGCLVNCSADADDEDVIGPDCCSSDAPQETPCAVGQDDVVDCRLCRGTAACQCGNPCG